MDSCRCRHRKRRGVAGKHENSVILHRASVTVEASLAFPLFLFAVYLLWLFFSILVIHVHLQQAADQVAGHLAQQSYLAAAWEHGTEDETDKGELEGMGEGISPGSILGDLAWKTYAGNELKKKAGEDFLNHTYIVSGAGGVSVAKSSWDIYGDLDLRVDYKVAFPALLGFQWKIPLTQHSLHRSWTGCQSRASDGEAEEGDIMVYVTETGRVYHRDINCYHLNLKIREVSYHGVTYERNQSGAKYYPCERCAMAVDMGGRVFIAKEGNRYHTTRECSGLKRTVNAVPLASLGGMRACSNCGG